jgi:hypothetical protein
LLERPTLLDQVLNPIANDHEHVTIFEDVSFVANTSVSRNDVGSTFLQPLRHGDVEDVVHAIDQTLNTATVLRVDHRIRRRHEDIAGHDHVRMAEVDDGIAAGVRGRRMLEKDRFAIEVEVFARLVIGIERPRALRHSSLVHSCKDILVCVDGSRVPVHRAASVRDGRIASGVIGISIRIHDPPNRAV